MHLHTIIKIRAANPEEAVSTVNAFLWEGMEQNNAVFDWFDEDATKVLTGYTEANFLKARAEEIAEYKAHLDKALSMDDSADKGRYLWRAGESLDDSIFWSSQRLVYDYTGRTDCPDEGEVYYVGTNRHY